MKKIKNLTLGVFAATLLAVGLYACSDDNEATTANNNTTTEQTTSIKSIASFENNEDYVYDFVKKHIEINDKIIPILENEPNLDIEIINEYSSETVTSENEFKNILRQSGIIKFNELSELISLQVQNSKMFQSNNPAFFTLDKLEQNAILTKYVDEVLNNNPNQTTSNCAGQLKKDRGRCESDLNFDGTVALIGCFSGPWTCAVGTVVVAAKHKICIDRAQEDYNDCLKGN